MQISSVFLCYLIEYTSALMKSCGQRYFFRRINYLLDSISQEIFHHHQNQNESLLRPEVKREKMSTKENCEAFVPKVNVGGAEK